MKAPIRLEDNFEDILGKAMAGLKISIEELSERSAVPLDRVHALMNGQFCREDLSAVSDPLGLHGPSLVEIAAGRSLPPEIELEGLLSYTTAFPLPSYAEMQVNAYLLFDPVTRKAVAFDTGASVSAMLRDFDDLQLDLCLILITHAHGDHIAALDQLREPMESLPVWINEKENLPGAKGFGAGKVFQAGRLRIETRLTNGHSPGGTSYLVKGLERPVAVVGDSLFCCSQGGAPDHYQTALDNNRGQILSLSDATILCPGHGPLTTVAFEKRHNPFFHE